MAKHFHWTERKEKITITTWSESKNGKKKDHIEKTSAKRHANLRFIIMKKAIKCKSKEKDVYKNRDSVQTTNTLTHKYILIVIMDAYYCVGVRIAFVIFWRMKSEIIDRSQQLHIDIHIFCLFRYWQSQTKNTATTMFNVFIWKLYISIYNFQWYWKLNQQSISFEWLLL